MAMTKIKLLPFFSGLFNGIQLRTLCKGEDFMVVLPRALLLGIGIVDKTRR